MQIPNKTKVLWRPDKQLLLSTVNTISRYFGLPDSVEELDCGGLGTRTALIYTLPKREYHYRDGSRMKRKKKEAGIGKSKRK